MKRRSFLKALSGVLAAPLVVPLAKMFPKDDGVELHSQQAEYSATTNINGGRYLACDTIHTGDIVVFGRYSTVKRWEHIDQIVGGVALQSANKGEMVMVGINPNTVFTI